MSDYDEVLKSAHDTALFGDGVFGGFAAVATDEDHREKLRLLQIVVRRDHRALAPFLEARGGSTRPTESEIAASVGATAADEGWDEFIKGLHDVHPGILDIFIRCRRLTPDPSHPAFAMVVRDTQAIIAFTELELMGFSESSRSVLDWALEGDA